jgi:hypothetical protein
VARPFLFKKTAMSLPLQLSFLFTYTFQFQCIPIDMGARQIHSPENFEYGGLLHVTSSHTPRRVGNYTSVFFSARTLLGEARVRPPRIEIIPETPTCPEFRVFTFANGAEQTFVMPTAAERALFRERLANLSRR